MKLESGERCKPFPTGRSPLAFLSFESLLENVRSYEDDDDGREKRTITCCTLYPPEFQFKCQGSRGVLAFNSLPCSRRTPASYTMRSLCVLRNLMILRQRWARHSSCTCSFVLRRQSQYPQLWKRNVLKIAAVGEKENCATPLSPSRRSTAYFVLLTV